MKTPLLDHIGIVGSDLSDLENAYRRLGFTVAPRCELLALAADGSTEPLAQHNCHLVMRDNYVELTAVAGDPKGHHLESALSRYYGLHILVFRTDDADETRCELGSRGLDLDPVAGAARQIAYPSGEGLARFRWFRVPEAAAPEAFACFVEHLDPDLVFDNRLVTHPNGATDLAAVHVCVDDLEESAQRTAVYLGDGVSTGAETRQWALADASLHLHTTAGLATIFAGITPPTLPWVAGFSVRVDSLADAGRCLSRAGVPFRRNSSGLWVEPDEACGVVVEFVGAQ